MPGLAFTTNSFVTCCVLLALALTPLRAEEPPATEAELAAMKKIQELGGQVLELAQNDKRLEVAYYQAGTKATDEALVPVKDLAARLYSLNLRGTGITDAGLAQIKEIRSLVRLHLEKTPLTDAGLEHLAGLENLEYLNVYGTAVTDAGLKKLVGLKKLKSLYVWQTQVTDAGVAELKAALPELKIIRGA